MSSRTRLAATALVLGIVSQCLLVLLQCEHSRQLTVQSFKTFVDERGTLQAGRKPHPIPCRYFVATEDNLPIVDSGKEIKKLHYHFADCAENQLGNRLGEHYLNYMLANAARIPYKMSCGGGGGGGDTTAGAGDVGDAKDDISRNNGDDNSTLQIIDPTHEKHLHESVLRHIAVDLEEPGPVPLDTWGGQPWNPAVMCSHCSRGGWWCNNGLNTMVPVITADMHKLAATSMGQSFDPEDAVIHVRLGDALKGKRDEGIGILPHQAYAHLLLKVENESGSPLKSIGIVTQPFERALVRSFDLVEDTLTKSKLIALDLVDYLKSKFPSAIVKIHNGADEIPLKSYARLIRAKRVAICGPSTFCTMPVLATFATRGYFFRAEKHSPWVKHVAQFSETLDTFKVPRLANNYSAILSGHELLHWCRHQLPTAGEFIIAGPPLLRNGHKILTSR